MRKILSKQISLGGILIIIFVLTFATVTIAATTTSIQATLSPDITVIFGGEAQILKDVNGNEVYPILYNGTTYLPVRAVAGLVEIAVDWDDSTRTVKLDKPVALMNSSEANFKLPCNTWVFDKYLFPDIKYNTGITCQAGSRINVIFELDKSFSRLAFDCFNNGENNLTVTVVSEKTGDTLLESEVLAGETISFTGIDIAGIREFRIRTSSSAVILDPVVY